MKSRCHSNAIRADRVGVDGGTATGHRLRDFGGAGGGDSWEFSRDADFMKQVGL